MLIDYAPEDQARFEEIGRKYDDLIDEKIIYMNSLREEWQPSDPDLAAEAKTEMIDPVAFDSFGRPQYDREEWSQLQEKRKESRMRIQNEYDKWIASGSEEWKRVRNEIDQLHKEKIAAYDQFMADCAAREFARLEGDPDRIREDALNKIGDLIGKRYHIISSSEENQEIPKFFSRLISGKYFVDGEAIKKQLNGLLKLHYDFFKDDPEGLRKMNEEILDLIDNDPRVSEEGEAYENYSFFTKVPEIKTLFPVDWISPKDKVTNKIFSGEMKLNATHYVNTASDESPTRWDNIIIMSFPNIPEEVEMPPISAFDKIVLDAVCTRYQESPVMTSQMLYAAMVNDPEARLTEPMRKEIYNSMINLRAANIRIKSSAEEAKSHNVDVLNYDGLLLYWEGIEAIKINGNTVKAREGTADGADSEQTTVGINIYKIMKEPVLKILSDRKGHIRRIPAKTIRTYNTRMTKQTIIIRSYLICRIDDMKHNPKLSKSILKDSIYNAAGYPDLSGQKLYKKRYALFSLVEKMLDKWATNKFIPGWKETTKSYIILFDEDEAQKAKKERISKKKAKKRKNSPKS